MSKKLMFLLFLVLISATAFTQTIKPDIDRNHAHIKCNWSAQGWDHITAFSYRMQDGVLKYEQPKSTNPENDVVALVLKKDEIARLDDDYNDYGFVFEGKLRGRSVDLEMSMTSMTAYSLVIPGKFLKNPHRAGTTAKVKAFLKKDQRGRNLEKNKHSILFICYRAG